jgi:intracellular septation protein
MKFLADFLPILLFFITFKWAGSHPEQTQELMGPVLSSISTTAMNPHLLPILLATSTAILITLVQVVIQKCLGRKIETMQWVGLILISVLGALTLIFQNDTFIKWKPTVLYLATAVGFTIAHSLNRNPIELMMKGQIELPKRIWNNLLWAWVFFFCLMAVTNIVIAYNFSTDVWVDFKFFGSLGATLLFVLGQGFYMSKHMTTSNEVQSTHGN